MWEVLRTAGQMPWFWWCMLFGVAWLLRSAFRKA